MSKRKSSGRKKNNLASLVNQAQSLTSSGRITKLSVSNEIATLSFGANLQPRAIDFGTAPRSGETATGTRTGGTVFNDLLKAGTENPFKSFLGGGLPALFGGSIFSGFASLFRGGSSNAAPSLVHFSLPESQSRTLAIGAKQISQPTNPSVAGLSTSGYSDRNADVVRAVKQALLTTTQLSDIISEL